MICRREEGEKKGKGGRVDGEEREEGKGSIADKRRGLAGGEMVQAWT